ncbi:hypothetical protein SDC9_80072 [bioreactor metagenome]|uniref:Uncharacterized protein n=1 Tax=bioreactor metagenome TaxID=1076179 RepID=A0A644YY79_9ZZZZ
MVISRTRDRNAKQVLIIVHRLDNRAEEEKELRVFERRFPWLQQVDAGVCRHGPVVVLAAAVNAGKGLFVQQADQTVLFGYALHNLHGQLVVIRGDIGRRKDRGQLVLRGRNFVMLGLGQYAKLPELCIEVFHKGLYARFDGTEVMVFQFLPLGGAGAVERAAGKYQIRAAVEHRLIDEEILLLGADGGNDFCNVLVAKEFDNAHRLTVDGLHGTKERGFLIQRLAAIGAERGRNAENLFLYKCIAGGIPCGIAARFESSAKAAGREAGSIRFAADKFLAGELHNHAAAGNRRDKAVVFFRRDAGERLEPVRKVRCALFDGPVFHGVSDHVRYGKIQPPPRFDCGLHRFVGVLGQTRLHDRVVKNLAAKCFRYHTHDYFLLLPLIKRGNDTTVPTAAPLPF